VKTFDRLDLFPQRWRDSLWEHGDPILIAFGLHDIDLPTLKVNVLNPQAEGLVQPEAASI
jgi:hypothetical protein